MTESAKQEKKTPKKGVIVLVLLIVIAALCAVGYGVWYQMPEQRFTRQMDLGERYLDDLDYEQAVAAFSTALSIQPDNEEAEEALSGAYVSWSDSYAAEGDYPSAVDTLTEGQQALPDNTAITDSLAQTYISWSDSFVTEGDYRSAVDTLREGQSVLLDNTSITDSLTDTYLAWVDALLSAGDLEGAQQVIAEAQQVVPGDEVTAKAEEIAKKQERTAAAAAVMESVPAELSSEDIEGSDEAITDWITECRADILDFIDDGSDSYIDPDNGFAIYRLQEGQYGLYVGDFNGQMREGTGSWLIFYDEARDEELGYVLYLRYHGAWSGDAPNGEMFFKSGSNTAQGTVVDGLWDGTLTASAMSVDYGTGSTWRETWTCTLSAGIYEVLGETDTNPNYPYIIGQTENGYPETASEEQIGKTHGVIGWAEDVM